MSRRRSTTQVVGHATFEGQHLRVYDNRKEKGIRATIFPHEENIRGPFGKKFKVSSQVKGHGHTRNSWTKRARRVQGGRTVPVLEHVF